MVIDMNPNLERILNKLASEDVKLEKHDVELALVDDFKSLNLSEVVSSIISTVVLSIKFCG
jgi:hypothetical protein